MLFTLPELKPEPQSTDPYSVIDALADAIPSELRGDFTATIQRKGKDLFIKLDADRPFIIQVNGRTEIAKGAERVMFGKV